MKIIITENQLEKILSSEKHRNAFMNMIEDEGIIDISKKFNIDYNDFIDIVFGEFDNEKVIKIIEGYLSNRFKYIFPLKTSSNCNAFYGVDSFCDTVIKAIIEHCYFNYYYEIMDDDSIEFGNIWLRLHRYIDLNFGDEIKDWYNKKCG